MAILTAIDVCAGAGGWAVAARGLPIHIIAAFDREPDCLATYAENHPDVECVQCDVIDHDFRTWAGKADLVLGGIPCEDISVMRNISQENAKTTKNDMDDFHALVDKCLAIPKLIGAQWYCFEDVSQITRHLPIFTPYFTIDSQYFSPQRRKRVYVCNFDSPTKQHNAQVLYDCLRPGPYRINPILKGRRPQRNKSFAKDVFYPWYPKNKSPTVISITSRHDNQMAVEYGRKWRQLEWQEAAQLQGFPKDYIFVGNVGRVGKMIGQAIQIDTGRAILKALIVQKDTQG